MTYIEILVDQINSGQITFEHASQWLRSHGLRKYKADCLLTHERQRRIKKELYRDLIAEQEAADEIKWEREYRNGVSVLT